MAKSVIKLKPIVGKLTPITLETQCTNIDTLIDTVFDSSGWHFAMIDNIGSISVNGNYLGNRQQILGWCNGNKQYTSLLILTFNGMFSATRGGSATATITKL